MALNGLLSGQPDGVEAVEKQRYLHPANKILSRPAEAAPTVPVGRWAKALSSGTPLADPLLSKPRPSSPAGPLRSGIPGSVTARCPHRKNPTDGGGTVGRVRVGSKQPRRLQSRRQTRASTGGPSSPPYLGHGNVAGPTDGSEAPRKESLPLPPTARSHWRSDRPPSPDSSR